MSVGANRKRWCMMRYADKAWEVFGKEDPYWAVLTHEKYRRDKLNSSTLKEFFDSGEKDVHSFLDIIERHISPGFKPSTSLDFGSGVGRLTIPLARISKKVIGMDTSRAMIEEARANCIAQGISNAVFLKSDENLSNINIPFDLVISYIAFQHICPERGYIILDNILDLLNSGGVGALHFTYSLNHPYLKLKSQHLYSLYTLIKRMLRFRIFNMIYSKINGMGLRINPIMDMHAYNLNKVLKIFQERGCSNIHSVFTDHGGWLGIIIFFQKKLV
jgi:2-polyprenyl-3-methyl-5-hydroxy-6-metoxy-1,4-benzoquinol methylase